jgi:hypothetical protein
MFHELREEKSVCCLHVLQVLGSRDWLRYEVSDRSSDVIVDITKARSKSGFSFSTGRPRLGSTRHQPSRGRCTGGGTIIGCRSMWWSSSLLAFMKWP